MVKYIKPQSGSPLYGTMTDEQVRNKILAQISTLTGGPQISIVDLPAGTYGEWTYGQPLKINKGTVQLFENTPTPNIATVQALRNSLIATILHEFVHYGDNWDFVDFVDSNGNTEEGILFEFDAFGRDISLPKQLNKLIWKRP